MNRPSEAVHALSPEERVELRAIFQDRLQFDAPLSRYTAARVGGRAEAMLEAGSVQNLVEIVTALWEMDLPFRILGGGSNVLVSDAGVPGMIILNRARQIEFHPESDPPTVWAASGANFGLIARQAGVRGLAGLAWAAGVPGTIGGAIFGNAGAHGGDMAGNLIVAEILQRIPGTAPQREEWPAKKLGFRYRSSTLKKMAEQNLRHPTAVILAGLLRLAESDPDAVQAEMGRYLEHRRRTQPPGASMGSMFKNPAGDYAGRLIEAAGLKGKRVGQAEISELHANFFMNGGGATAGEVYDLIRLAQRKVAEQFGVVLELEIELIGDWSGIQDAS